MPEKRPPTTLYGPAIHNAAASGDLAEMKKVAAEAETFVREHGDIGAALESLRIEIAKLEARH
jgi:hypothetical protein